MDIEQTVRGDLSPDETRELARFATAAVGIMAFFALVGIVIVIGTGDVASALGAAVNLAAAILLAHGRRQLLRGDGGRAAVLLVGVVLVGVLALAPVPPPTPGLAAAPIMAVAFALSFLHGRRLIGALVAAFVTSVLAAIIVEFTPASPDLPAELAAALRIGTMAAVTGFVGLVLYRHSHRLELAVSAARAAGEALVVRAFRDELTGLPNRALFKDRLEHALARRATGSHLVGLLYLDVDRFKTVNDSLGHGAGDTLLIAIAARLQAILRPEDTIARFGGDEFAILVEDVHHPEDLLALADRVRSAFEAPFVLAKRQVTIRASIGVDLAMDGIRGSDDLLRDVDVAMYRSKVEGRGALSIFEPSMQSAVAGRLELEADLRDAIDRDALTLAYQPIVTLPEGRIVAVEALSRWQHPTRGAVPPPVFIACAEENGLIVTLGRRVLRRACADVAALRRVHPAAATLRLAVNVSPRQLSDPGFVEDVLGALRVAGLPEAALDLEVTEGVVLDCGEAGIERLRVLRDAGVGVALDDFGTGYSSLGNLRTLPIDQLKVDQSFVAAVLDGGIESAVVDAVVRLGAALGAAVVAEGIETAAVAERLAELGCPLGQGYHFGRPEPLDDLARRLAGPTLMRRPPSLAAGRRSVVPVGALG